MLVTVNNRLKFEIEIVNDLSCHPILLCIAYIIGMIYKSLSFGSWNNMFSVRTACESFTDIQTIK